nr:hypothetical protein [candidate division Zixibacteria bacterium]
MKKSFLIILIIMIAGSIPLVWMGCSDSTTSVEYTAPEEPGLTEYFPMKTGSSIQYAEYNHVINDTGYYIYTIGGSATVGTHQGHYWIKSNLEFPAQVDSGVVYYEGEALYYIEDAADIPEKLLEAPFTVGRAWVRYDASQISLEYNIIDSILNNNDSKYDDNYNGLGGDDGGEIDDNNMNGATKSFPTLGANYFQISACEDIVLEQGVAIDECLRVENKNGRATNYYWYAPGTGLVKYVLGVNIDTYPDGEVVGEIIL